MDANGELTAPELALLRTHPQRTDLHLAIPTYATIFTAEVGVPNPASNDGVYELTFTAGSGAAFADVVSGMTLLVGSVAGGSDIGLARIRDVVTSGDGGTTGTICIGTTSEIDFAVGQNLTITNEFGLWPRHPYVDPATGEAFMDYDIDYDNVANPQHVYFAPVPCMLPSAVVELTGASVTVTFDASDSWAPILYLPPTYTWSCAGATVPGGSTIQKIITFTSAGTYLVKLELQADYAGGHSATSIGYRYVIVYDDAHPLIKSPVLESCEGDIDTGGWSYRVTCRSQADLTTIHNRTLCMLVADDWYGDTHQSIGPMVDRENIVAIGWIDGESITWSNDTGDVSFDVQGPQWWLDRMEGYPTGVDDALVASTVWTSIENLTARAGLWHFLYWRTTAAAVLDIPGVAQHGWTAPDTRRLATTYTPEGSLWEQLRAMADRIFARAACNRYGQLYINVDMQLVDPAIRGTHPNILGVSGFTGSDWRDEITIERRTVPEAGIVDLSGVYWSGVVATSSALFALSPGHYFKHYGQPTPRDRVSLADQAQANMLAGLYMGWLNNEYPNVDVPLSANNRCFDIVPYMFSLMSISAADTPRGIEWTDKRLIPRRVSFERDASAAVMLVNVTFEAETFANTAMIGDPPIEPPPPPPPPILCENPLALNYGGSAPCIFAPPLPTVADMVVFHNRHHVVRCANFFDLTSAALWEDITPAIFDHVNDGIMSLAIDPDGLGAWLVTDGPDKTTCGVFRTDNIVTGSFSLSLSQLAACGIGGMGNIAEYNRGWITLFERDTLDRLAIMQSSISFGNGCMATTENQDAGGFGTNPPSVSYATVDGGATWGADVVSGAFGQPRFFTGGGFGYAGCHHLDFDGASITATGWMNDAGAHTGGVATSVDGLIWNVSAQDAVYKKLYSCNAIGAAIYAFELDTVSVINLPAGVYQAPPLTTNMFGFRRTAYGANLVEILARAVGTGTELYVGAASVMPSGGEAATISVAVGGGGYSVNDVLTLTALGSGTAATATVTNVAGGVVTAVALTTAGSGYVAGVYATTVAPPGGAGCTINVLTVANEVPPFGIARVLAGDEWITVATDAVIAGNEVVTYYLAGNLYNRTGDLDTAIGGGWEGSPISDNYDDSGMEVFASAI